MERIGIIDLGSNTARLVIVDLFAEGHFMVTDQLKESVRLGQDMDRDGFLKPQRVAETIRALKMFKRLCDASGVSRIIAVATAAVRRAKNQRSFLDEIQATCGIKIRVLSEEEEAILVYRGVINTMDIPKGLILEIGGGSTKVIYYNRRNVIGSASLPFGAVTLTDLFANDCTPEEAAAHTVEFFTEQLKKIDWLSEVDTEEVQMIGVGGSFRNLFKISKLVKKYPLDTVHNYRLSTDDFNVIYDKIKALDIDKRKKIRGLSPSRADIMPAAMAIIKSFVDYMGVKDFAIGGNGLREGIMFNQSVPMTVEKPISDVLNYSLETLVLYYGKGIMSPAELERDFADFVKRVRKKYPMLRDIYCDSAEQVLIRGLQNAAIRERLPVEIHNARKGEISQRIRFYNAVLSDGRYKILAQCKNTIAAFSQAVWEGGSLDRRLDDGSVNIDSLDAQEYSTERRMKDILDVMR